MIEKGAPFDEDLNMPKLIDTHSCMPVPKEMNKKMDKDMGKDMDKVVRVATDGVRYRVEMKHWNFADECHEWVPVKRTRWRALFGSAPYEMMYLASLATYFSTASEACTFKMMIENYERLESEFYSKHAGDFGNWKEVNCRDCLK